MSGVHSVRVRVLAIALLPLLASMPLLLGYVIFRWWNTTDQLLIDNVRADLGIARQYVDQLVENSGEKVVALGNSVAFARHVSRDDREALAAFLASKKRELGFDFLFLRATNSQERSESGPETDIAAAEKWSVVQRAMEGKTSAALDVMTSDELKRISPELAQQARIELIPTTAAAPTSRTSETRGLVVHASTPVKSAGGTASVLVGGILLNRNLSFIDSINDLVFPEDSLRDGSRGTATLFLDDVRISTNVRLFENVRAIGTRVSEDVRDLVLVRGGTWLDRAFVVNDWYISAYEPIRDTKGTTVGMLYVGFLEKPFRDANILSILASLAALLLVAGLTAFIVVRWARRIFMPLEAMTTAISRVDAGDLSARSGVDSSNDEIGTVAHRLDALLEQMQMRDRDLNEKVELRTRELKEANRRLEDATQQLVMAEKLAAIGEITSGVAHEINNPVAVIQGNIEVIRESLGPDAEPVSFELRLIDEQVTRINLIINKLLQFARPAEFSGDVDRTSVDQVISDCLLLVRHVMKDSHIDVIRDEKATQQVAIDRTALQQVVINLIVNAAHAMAGHGTLTIATRNEALDGREGTSISIQDTGGGIQPEVLKKIFDPFFTTKRNEGTGLGLSISHMLIKDALGRIEVESSVGQGTTFRLWLPRAD